MVYGRAQTGRPDDAARHCNTWSIGSSQKLSPEIVTKFTVLHQFKRKIATSNSNFQQGMPLEHFNYFLLLCCYGSVLYKCTSTQTTASTKAKCMRTETFHCWSWLNLVFDDVYCQFLPTHAQTVCISLRAWDELKASENRACKWTVLPYSMTSNKFCTLYLMSWDACAVEH